MIESDIVHIALAPPASCDPGLVEDVAAAIGRGTYDTGLLMSGEIPKIIAHYTSMEAARQVMYELKALGLTVLAMPDSDLHLSPRVFRAHTLEFESEKALFADGGGRREIVTGGDAFMLLAGRMHSEIEVGHKKTGKKFDIAATMLTGGIPVWRQKEEKSSASSLQTEHFVRIYSRDYSGLCIELLQHRMDYSFLGESVEVSSLKNLGVATLKLREAFPRSIYDSRLEKPFATGISRKRTSADIEVQCRLIHAFHMLAAAH